MHAVFLYHAPLSPTADIRSKYLSKSISQKKGLKHENSTITTIKGQVISKALFGISILPKNERKKIRLR